jgi:hypothetical protein
VKSSAGDEPPDKDTTTVLINREGNLVARQHPHLSIGEAQSTARKSGQQYFVDRLFGETCWIVKQTSRFYQCTFISWAVDA